MVMSSTTNFNFKLSNQFDCCLQQQQKKTLNSSIYDDQLQLSKPIRINQAVVRRQTEQAETEVFVDLFKDRRRIVNYVTQTHWRWSERDEGWLGCWLAY